jgi:rhodanese-related sulfurtransferase
MTRILSVVLAFAFAVPTFAQEEGAGEYASMVARGNPLGVPPGIYANVARRLDDFFAATAGARTVYADVLRADLAAGKPQLVLDIRPAADFAAGHIAGAVSIPLTELFASENLVALPTDGTPIVIVCHTGHTASMAMGGLTALGYNAYVLRFGMMGWRASTNTKVYSNGQVPQTVYGLGGEVVK